MNRLPTRGQGRPPRGGKSGGKVRRWLRQRRRSNNGSRGQAECYSGAASDSSKVRVNPFSFQHGAQRRGRCGRSDAGARPFIGASSVVTVMLAHLQPSRFSRLLLRLPGSAQLLQPPVALHVSYRGNKRRLIRPGVMPEPLAVCLHSSAAAAGCSATTRPPARARMWGGEVRRAG